MPDPVLNPILCHFIPYCSPPGAPLDPRLPLKPCSVFTHTYSPNKPFTCLCYLISFCAVQPVRTPFLSSLSNPQPFCPSRSHTLRGCAALASNTARMCPMQTNPCTAQHKKASQEARSEHHAGLGMGRRESFSTQQRFLAAREGSGPHCLAVGFSDWRWRLVAACTTHCRGCCKQGLLVFTCLVGRAAAAAASTAALPLRRPGVGQWGAPYNTLAALGLLCCRSTACRHLSLEHHTWACSQRGRLNTIQDPPPELPPLQRHRFKPAAPSRAGAARSGLPHRSIGRPSVLLCTIQPTRRCTPGCRWLRESAACPSPSGPPSARQWGCW